MNVTRVVFHTALLDRCMLPKAGAADAPAIGWPLYWLPDGVYITLF